MTTRLKWFTVILDRDIRDDDAQPIIEAISMIKGVISVENIEIDMMEDTFARRRVKSEILEEIVKLLNK